MNSELLAELVNALNRREPVAMLTVTHATGLFAGRMGSHCLLWQDPRRKPLGDLGLGDLTDQVIRDALNALADHQHRMLSYETDDGAVRIFAEVQTQPPRLLIVGAGHIAVPLATIAALCDFQVIVLDDRPQYADAARFPDADRVIAGPFRDELRKLRQEGSGFDASTFVVLVTRGHQHDVECLLELLDDPLAYIGMIGSQRRIKAVFQLLENEQNVAPEKLDRVYAPIGLDIGARTPAEIAVCIMAEIISVMRGGRAESLSERIRRERIARRHRARIST